MVTAVKVMLTSYTSLTITKPVDYAAYHYLRCPTLGHVVVLYNQRKLCDLLGFEFIERRRAIFHPFLHSTGLFNNV